MASGNRRWHVQTLHLLHAPHTGGIPYGRERKDATDRFVNALLLGIAAAAILQPFAGGAGFEAITQTPFRGQFAYLAVMGFGVTYVRLLVAPFREPATCCI